MPVNSTHLDYDANLAGWLGARDVIAGEDAVKIGGIKYLPRLDSQSDNEYLGYKSRACFFNATSRTCDGFLGLLFRRDPEVKLPDRHAGVGGALRVFTDDVDLMGTSLFTFCKGVTGEVLSVGRTGTLIDWEGGSATGNAGASRAYVVRYTAEAILNWQTGRINGRNVVTLVCLREMVERPDDADPFVVNLTETVRVLKLEVLPDGGTRYVVELWSKDETNKTRKTNTAKWKLAETRIPLRLGKPLPLIPFVFHGPRNALPDVDKMPLDDIIRVNLDHYRLDADYKHGLHFTALPTAWVSGFDKESELRIGSSTAWVAEMPGAVAGFLEFKGHGLSTFENAMNRDERLMAVLGSRMLEDTKRVGETADAIELRQAGENSILMTLALSLSDSISQVLRWVYWWNSTEHYPEDVSESLVLLRINTDFTAKGLTSMELTAIVSAWQAGAISQATMFDLFRKGEVLPTGRTDAEEKSLINQIGQEKMTGVFPKAGNSPREKCFTQRRQGAKRAANPLNTLNASVMVAGGQTTKFMALKNKYASAGEIPAELKSFYVERDGAWLLDSERNEELRQTNITVMKERDELKKRFEGIDPDAVHQLAEEKRKLEEAAQLKAGEFEKVSATRLDEWKKLNHSPVVAERDALHGRLSAIQIDQAVVNEATKRGLRPTAIPDATARARSTFKLVAGVPQAFDGDGQTARMGKDGTSPMTLAEWVDALVSDAPHLFEANAGGGAAGSGSRGAGGGVVNPFRKETWNLTEQTKLLKTNPGLAARLQASA